MKLSHHFLPRPDGTQICWFDSGTPGPVVLLANGLGGPVSALRPYFEHFARTRRVVSWDYRGLYASGLGAGAQLDVAAHAADALAIMRKMGEPIDTYVGWSMGVQVGLELYRQEPAALTRLVLMNGAAGRPLDRVPAPGAAAVRQLLGWAHRLRWMAPAVIQALGEAPRADLVLKHLGFIAHEFEASLYREVLRGFQSLDFDAYFRILAGLLEHDAEAVLPDVAIPTLVIAGSRDRITPPHLARKLAGGIRGAEYFALPRASHYAAAEYPEVVIARIERFMTSAPRGLRDCPPFASVTAAS